MRIVTFLLFVCALSAQAQQPMTTFGEQGTTLEEYNYINHGYKTQKESGLDMKKGYSFKFLLTVTKSDHVCEVFGLYKDGYSNPCAFMMDYYNGRKRVYICVPHYSSSQRLWDDMTARIERDFSFFAQQLFFEAMSKMVSYFKEH